MKVILAGGSGNVGAVLTRHFLQRGDEVVIFSRSGKAKLARAVKWDGKTLGGWGEELENADVVFGLAGRSVNCRYNAANLKEMMDSRVDSTRVLGEAISLAKNPPRVWMQASTATIYAHRFDAPNDDETGIIGGDQPGEPPKWKASIEIAKAWEKTLFDADTPKTRKAAMRSSMTMSADKGSIFDVLCSLAKRGLGGKIASGKQYISWIHEDDFADAVQFIIDRDHLSGPINICSPNPLPQVEFMQILRDSLGVNFGLPTAAWMAEIGAFLMQTETELIFKSRRVVPSLLLREGFSFKFPEWKDACPDLVHRLKINS